MISLAVLMVSLAALARLWLVAGAFLASAPASFRTFQEASVR
jgi:hypothetical protein